MVAEAARQERAQKESNQKKSKHVYTEQDLKRAQILTPEDRAQAEAKKNQPAAPSAEKSTEAVDAQSVAPDAPLGERRAPFPQAEAVAENFSSPRSSISRSPMRLRSLRRSVR